MDTKLKSSSSRISPIRHKRRRGLATSSSCSKSFARYCVALLGSLTVESLAAPTTSSTSTSSSLSYKQKLSRSISSSIESLNSLEVPQLDVSRLYTRGVGQTPSSINKASIIVGVCGGIAFLFAVLAAFLYWRAKRHKHMKGKCDCDEKGKACKYRPPASRSLTSGHDDDEEDHDHDHDHDGPRERGGVTPPGSPRQSLLSPPLHKNGERIRWSISGPSSRDSTGPFYDVDGFEYPPNYKPPPSAFRSHSPSTSSEFLVPAGIANLISPITPRDPLLGHRGLPNNDDVTITPPRTPSPARFAKRSQSPHLRNRSLSAVDLSRSDGELQEDLDAIVRELQRRPRSGSIDRLVPSRSNSPPPPPLPARTSQEFVMELEASPGMWNEDMLRDRGVVHEAVSQEFAVELDSRPLTLGVKRTRRVTERFQ
ncbi:hypothetical protein TWF694_004484 [Orbilia ellipsospora]|uniref:Uncharacterized protein n=1 Tax=Orbilia ellipsospora TaxID=2528407 RepID=A0AAV9WWT9_9PEZI